MSKFQLSTRLTFTGIIIAILGCSDVFAETLADVTTEGYEMLSKKSALLKGTVTPNGYGRMGYFLYRISPDGNWIQSDIMGYAEVGSGIFPVKIEITVNDLIYGEIYQYKLIAENYYYTQEGEEKSFDTNEFKGEGTLKWSFTSDSTEDVHNPDNLCDMDTSPAIGDDGIIYMATNDYVHQDVKNYLYAINPDGSLKWKKIIVEGSTPIIDNNNGIIYVMSSKGKKLYAFSSDGILKWDFDFIQINPLTSYYSMPALGPSGVIYVADTDRLHAINPDGTLKWTLEFNDCIKKTIVVCDDSIYVPVCNSLYAIDHDGNINWSIDGGTYLGNLALGSDGSVFATGEAYLEDVNDGRKFYEGVFKLNKTNGELSVLYETNYGYYTDFPLIVGENDTIFYRTRSRPYYGASFFESILHAINSDGTLKWEIILNNNVLNIAMTQPASPALIYDGTVLTPASDGKLYAINDDGTNRWEFDTGNIALQSSPVIGIDGTIFIGSAVNKLFAINNDSRPLASTAWPMLQLNRKHTGFKEVKAGMPDSFDAMKIISGQSADIDASDDVSGDGKIGLPEAIYPLQVMSDQRPQLCGAYVASGVWKEFDCYNLAAIGKTTDDDPFTPSWRLIGGYWQWGRKGPDPSEWYDTNTPHFAHGPTGPDTEDANDGAITGWDQEDVPDGSWSDTSKTANDPCPAGFRVPTKTQWDGVMISNNLSPVGGDIMDRQYNKL